VGAHARSRSPAGATASVSITVPGHRVSIELVTAGTTERGSAAVGSPLRARTLAAADLRRELHGLRDVHLSRALGVPIEALRYDREASGRPVLRDPAGGPDFSVSRTTGLVAVASVAAGGRVGVDVERLRGLRLDRFRRAFSPREWARIRASDDPAAEALHRWTRKEALLKATGIGLRVPLATVPSDGTPDTPPMTLRPTRVVDPERRLWAVWSTALAAPGYLVTCAVEAAPGSRPSNAR
jgi:4'-phosphopantetheinyl transferase